MTSSTVQSPPGGQTKNSYIFRASTCCLYLVSCVLQQLCSRQSGHARPDNDNMMRCVNGWEAGLRSVQQHFMVFVLQTMGQVFLHTESSSSMATAQCEQHHTNSNWRHIGIKTLVDLGILTHFQLERMGAFKSLIYT